MSADILSRLAAVIADRRTAAADGSYTRQLLDGGPPRAAKKLGEEAVETIVAALGEDRAALTAEAADLLYHLLVLLETRGVAVSEVLAELERREVTSGVTEKAARKAL